MNAKIIEKLQVITGALVDITDILGSSEVEVGIDVAKVAEKMSEALSTGTAVEENLLPKSELEVMKYNDLKKHAKSLGLDNKGTKDELIGRILATGSPEEGADIEDEEDPVEEEAVKEEDKPTKAKASKKTAKAKKDDEPSKETMDTVAELMDEYDVADIVKILSDEGIKVTKKMQKDVEAVALILGKAIESGTVVLDTAEEEEEEADEESQEEEQEELDIDLDVDSYFEEYDFFESNNPDDMTPKRKKAIKKMMKKIIADLESGDLDMEKNIFPYLTDMLGEEEQEALGDEIDEETAICTYVEVRKRMVDDDGDEMKPSEAYELNEESYCCGNPLAEDGDNFKCSICGTVYQAE